MSITPAGSAVAFILLLALPSAWHRAGLRVVPVVVDVNDIFISNEYTRLKMGIFFCLIYFIDMQHPFIITEIISLIITSYFYVMQALLPSFFIFYE